MAILFLVLGLLQVLNASDAIKKEYRSLFLDKYQRAAMEGDHRLASKLARERDSTDKDRELASHCFLDFERQGRIQILSILEADERMTEESFEPPKLENIDDVISMYRFAFLARRAYYFTIYVKQMKLLEESQRAEKELREFIKDKDQSDPIVQTKIRQHVSKTTKIFRILNLVGIRLGKAFLKYSERKAFIIAHPQFFIDPSAVPVKVLLRPRFGPIAQSIAFIDAFKEMIPRNLQQFCTNFAELKELSQQEASVIYTEDLHSNVHGVHVAGFALTLAHWLSFEAIPSSLIGTTIHSIPKQDYPDAAFYRVDGPAISERDIEFLINNPEDPIFVTAQGINIYSIPWYRLQKISSPIINVSLNFQDSRDILGINASHHDVASIMAVAYAFTRYMVEQEKLAVFAIGNESLVLSTSIQAYSLIKAMAACEQTREKMIVVTALATDGISIARFSNQPGDHILAERTICAPGEELYMPDGFARSGASFSTPIVSVALANLKSHLPWLPQKIIAQTLLDAATPVIMREDSKPMLLKGVLARDFKAGVTVKIGSDEIFISEEIFKISRAKYGMGVLNLEAAHQLATDSLMVPAKL